MTLFHPGTNIVFNITPSYLLGVFNVYDREDDLEIELNKLDPNKENELDNLIKEYFVESAQLNSLTTEHKKRILEVIKVLLNEPSHDFSQYFIDDDESCFYLPSEWNIKRPRDFYTKAYEILSSEWRVK